MGWDFGNAIYGGFKVGLQGGLPGLVIMGPAAFVICGFVTKEQIDAGCQGASETANDYVNNAFADNWPSIATLTYVYAKNQINRKK